MSSQGRMARATRIIEQVGQGVPVRPGGYRTPIFPFQQRARTQIKFGVPVSAFSSGATILLDPCDSGGTDNGEVNVAVSILGGSLNISSYDAGIGSAQATNCTIGSGVIVQYAYDAAGVPWTLGAPEVQVVGLGWNSTDFRITALVRFVVGGGISNISDPLDAVQFYDCNA